MKARVAAYCGLSVRLLIVKEPDLRARCGLAVAHLRHSQAAAPDAADAAQFEARTGGIVEASEFSLITVLCDEVDKIGATNSHA